MSEVIAFFRDGGSWMYAILLVFILGIAVIVERIYFISIKNRIDSVAFVNRVLELIQRGNYANAIEFCRMSQAALPRIVCAGLEEAGKRPKDIQQAFELASMVEIPKLEKRTAFLGVFANVATLLGLLGTIFGLIGAFAAVANAPAAEKAVLLTAGISVAMNTTALGIIVAIPCMLAHSYLQEQTSNVKEQISTNVVRIYNRLVALKG